MSSRRKIFKALALGTISLPIALRLLMGETKAQGTTKSNRSNKIYQWKMTTTWPPNFPVLQEACDMFANLIHVMSDERISITVYGGGELAPPLKAFDTVVSGGAEMGCGAAYYWAGKSAAAQFFATVPFGLNAQQHTGWMLNGGGLELWRELYAKFNLVPFLGGNTGVQMGGWFNREINSMEDIQGLKMRIPGLGGAVFEQAGGAQTLYPGSELYSNLERGVIDATEWLGPYHDTLMGFHEIADYYYTPGWHEPGTALEFFLRKDIYDDLTPELQAIIEAASRQVHLWVWMEMEKRNAEALSSFMEKGIQVREFPPDVLATFRRLTEEVLNTLTADDPFAAEVYTSFKTFRANAKSYAAVTEQRFYNELI